MSDSSVALVTGGTGSFGKTIVKRLLKESDVRVRVFSRDEGKQDALREELSSDRVEFITGDVRDPESVETAMRGARWVFHAAALKQVPNCERFPIEAVRTNVLGSENVRRAAVRCGPEAVIAISTDKACAPINAMGLTKALMERLFLREREDGCTTRFVCTRYGNVLGSRGSVVPLFLDRIRRGLPLPITDGKMTRFLLTLEDAVEMALSAISHGSHGEVWVKKMPAATIHTLAHAVAEAVGVEMKGHAIGIRPGEKMHETLINEDEVWRTLEKEDCFIIRPSAVEKPPLMDEYTSANTERLSTSQVVAMLSRAGLV